MLNQFVDELFHRRIVAVVVSGSVDQQQLSFQLVTDMNGRAIFVSVWEIVRKNRSEKTKY